MVTKSIVSEATEKVMEAWSHNFFDHIWNYECDTEADKKLLCKVSKNKSHLNIETAKSYGASLRKLKQRDLLVEDDGYVKLTMPIVRDWLLRENHI